MSRPRYTNTSLHGLLVVDKPLQWSSMDVVRQVRRAAGNAKTGHAGTLDPLATGVVVCCLGNATKLIDQLMGMAKVYEADVDLSAFTATDDREAAPEPMTIASPPVEAQLRDALAGFVGVIQQKPPAFSAMHIDGQRAYKLARKGREVDIPARPVRIDAIELIDYAFPITRIRVTCGKGTYIRSLARDIGIALGTGGHLAALRRTRVGPYDLSMAVDANRLQLPIGESDLQAMPASA